MASSSTPVHPARYLTSFWCCSSVPTLLVFFTGDKQAKPKLGIDLQGGTRVTLTARTPDGSAPTREALDQAQQIISDRVNGLGVSGSEVIIDGNNLVITVPGNDSSEARNLGQTARLYIRPVIHVDAGPAVSSRRPRVRRVRHRARHPWFPGRRPACHQSLPRSRGLPSHRPASRCLRRPAQTPAPQPRPYPQEPPPTPAPPPTPRVPAPPPGAPGAPVNTPPPTPNPEDLPLSERIADEKQLRQSTDQQIQLLALQFQATRCDEDDVLAGNDDPNLPLVTCSTDGNQVYLLDKSIISGEQIEDATSGLDQQRGRIRRRPAVQERRRQGLGRLHRRQRRHPDRLRVGLEGGQRSDDQ